ncbi:DUF2155 domain-containing protein [Candidatus Phycorickettsia trachydisci]|uniref:DUF2155 domain-containing protein n=1 Tax=Candidatus Phycorickettsia trachydisci TaxID=2115978 RepID=UPI00131A4BFF|nr:DUF2155 domain-containing protein [Candidatus Phycorickettsia trachydisci]
MTSFALAGDVFDVIDTDELMPTKFKEFSEAELIGIHKITANSQKLNIKVDESQFFYNLEVKIEKCVRNNDLYNQDDYALISLTDYKMNDDAKMIFRGWISANSISLSTFEHPIYEIFLGRCK